MLSPCLPLTLGVTDQIVRASFSVGPRTIWTRVRPYRAAVPTAMSKEEHDALHSERPDSKSEYPHSISIHPIHQVPGDYDSPVVAVLGGGTAWDYALRGLLPATVKGIHVVVRNNCNQTYTYKLDGQDAFFVEAGDLHESQYDDMEVRTSLSLWDDEDFISTPGHCVYSIVSNCTL